MRRTYPSIGRCIYCGSTTYSSERPAPLGDEHIIPEALNGDAIFAGASCQACERVTGRVEARICRNHMIGPRWSMELRSKTPQRKRSRNLRLYRLAEDDTAQTVDIDADDYPSVLFLLRFGLPPIIRADLGGPPESKHDLQPWMKWFHYNHELLRTKYGVGSFAVATLDTRSFCRLLAKIAHGLAVATLGPDGFSPFLGRMISDSDLGSRALLPYVGCLPEEPPGPALHEMELVPAEADNGDKLIMARIRLFAQLGAPSYLVVVGSPPGEHFTLPTVGEAELAARHNFYRIHVPLKGNYPTSI